MQDNSYTAQKRRELEKEFFNSGVTEDQIKLLSRVEEMLSKAFQAGYKAAAMFESEEWSNNACLGYAILGARGLGYTEKQIQAFVHSIKSEFDFRTIDEAKGTYNNSPF